MLNSIIKVLFFYFGFAFIFICKAYTSQTIIKDSTSFLIRKPSADKIFTFKKDKDFIYIKQEVVPNNVLELLLKKLGRFLEILFSNKGAMPIIRNGIILVLFLFLLFKITRTKFKSLFLKNKDIAKFVIDEENIDPTELDIDMQIGAEIENANYRSATRYLYLKLLKLLNTSGYINWKKEKTNLDYIKEINEQEVKPVFIKLTSNYEYIWYGNFVIDKEVFNSIYSEFDRLYKKINV